MNILPCTDHLINNIVTSLLPADASLREQHLLRETLNGLVRLAKSEQMMEVKNNVRHLTGKLAEQTARTRLRSECSSVQGGGQQQFGF